MRGRRGRCLRGLGGAGRRGSLGWLRALCFEAWPRRFRTYLVDSHSRLLGSGGTAMLGFRGSDRDCLEQFEQLAQSTLASTGASSETDDRS